MRRLIAAAALVALAGCGGQAESQPTPSQVAQLASPTAAPEATSPAGTTPTALPTATEGPTNTPLPSRTPAPT
ncbi:MAG TPA: hypothetical protein VGE07_29210, partial [Herpetosiphonaceae bacterium]